MKSLSKQMMHTARAQGYRFAAMDMIRSSVSLAHKEKRLEDIRDHAVYAVVGIGNGPYEFFPVSLELVPDSPRIKSDSDPTIQDITDEIIEQRMSGTEPLDQIEGLDNPKLLCVLSVFGAKTLPLVGLDLDDPDLGHYVTNLVYADMSVVASLGDEFGETARVMSSHELPVEYHRISPIYQQNYLQDNGKILIENTNENGTEHLGRLMWALTMNPEDLHKLVRD